MYEHNLVGNPNWSLNVILGIWNTRIVLSFYHFILKLWYLNAIYKYFVLCLKNEPIPKNTSMFGISNIFGTWIFIIWNIVTKYNKLILVDDLDIL